MGSQPRNLIPPLRTTTEHGRLLAFVARLCLVLMFPLSCLNKIFDFQSAMAQAAHGWIPLPPTIAALLLMLGLPRATWERLIIWMVVGIVIYFAYGYRRSHLQLSA